MLQPKDTWMPESMMLPKAMSGAKALLQLRSVLMPEAQVATKKSKGAAKRILKDYYDSSYPSNPTPRVTK